MKNNIFLASNTTNTIISEEKMLKSEAKPSGDFWVEYILLFLLLCCIIPYIVLRLTLASSKKEYEKLLEARERDCLENHHHEGGNEINDDYH